VQRLVVELFLGFHSLQIQKLYFRFFSFEKLIQLLPCPPPYPWALASWAYPPRYP
jgi:hypothetical protein